jgi:hypothetical protein
MSWRYIIIQAKQMWLQMLNLSRKSQVNMMVAHPMLYELAKEFDRLSLGFLNNIQGVTVELEPTLEQDIRKGQKDDEKIIEI